MILINYSGITPWSVTTNLRKFYYRTHIHCLKNRHTINQNGIVGDTEKPSGGFDQLQISCSCGNGIACAKLEKLISNLSSICQYAFTMLWVSLDTCCVDSKHLSNSILSYDNYSDNYTHLS